jgi:hypothetical protein
MRWEDTVKREFTPVSWSTTVEALLQGLRQPLAAVADGAIVTPPREALISAHHSEG